MSPLKSSSVISASFSVSWSMLCSTTLSMTEPVISVIDSSWRELVSALRFANMLL